MTGWWDHNHKENCHVRIHPRGSLTRAVSARPCACCCPVGANSETGCGGEETSPSRSRRNASAKGVCPGSLANMQFPSERGTDKRDENLETISVTGWTLSAAVQNPNLRLSQIFRRSCQRPRATKNGLANFSSTLP